MIKVKICGITNLEDALHAFNSGADAIGFIFTKKSPRYIAPAAAKKIVQKLGPFSVRAGVFLDEDKDKVLKAASELSLDVLQFHGKESPEYCRFFRRKFKVIKVLFPEDSPFKRKISRYDADAFLFDVKPEEKIKSKGKLSAVLLKEISGLIKSGVKVIISGGLNAKNVAAVKKLKPYAVDVCGGVEKSIGRKDKKLVDCFIRKIKY